jgi:putative ABC transport system permease protein
MTAVALRMLFGDRAKYFGLVFGVAFATLLVTQQGGVFVGLMTRTASVIDDIREADIWVMDPQARYIDTVRALRDTDLARVRGVEGVAWAVPLYKTSAPVKTLDGRIDNALVLGVDDATLIGLPRDILLGRPEDLRRPDAIAIDQAGYLRLWPGEALQLGRELELNDRRAVIVAITQAAAAFTASIIIHAPYSRAVTYLPQGRDTLSFVLARAAPGRRAADVARAIAARTGLQALSSADFHWKTIAFYLANTGIPISFGLVIVLGVVVGVAVVGLTFNTFVAENIRQYGALKAMGLSDLRLVGLVMLQGLVVGLVGYGIGLGLAAAFFQFATQPPGALRGFALPWWVAAGDAGLTAVIVLLAMLASLRRVLVLDPAFVFRA